MTAVGGVLASPADELLKWYTGCMLAFWTSPHNGLREGPPLRAETIESHAGRLGRFIAWCQHNGHYSDPVTLCSNMHMVTQYLDHLQKRDTVAGSRATVCDAVLSLLKCMWANPMQQPPWAPMVLQSVRAMRNALVAQYDVELRGRSNREALNEQGRWASWDEIVAASKAIVAEFQLKHRRAVHVDDKDWSPDEVSACEWCVMALSPLLNNPTPH